MSYLIKYVVDESLADGFVCSTSSGVNVRKDFVASIEGFSGWIMQLNKLSFMEFLGQEPFNVSLDHSDLNLGWIVMLDLSITISQKLRVVFFQVQSHAVALDEQVALSFENSVQIMHCWAIHINLVNRKTNQ